MTDLTQPVEAHLEQSWVDGRPGRRLMVVLRAPGCAHALKTGGCTNCGFLELTTRGAPVSTAQLVAQLGNALRRHQEELDEIEELDLYCSGSFFNDDELSPASRRALLEFSCALPGLRSVLVDSRPEYVTPQALGVRSTLGDPRRVLFEVAIGLETASDEIRLQRIRKGFTLAEFERAAETIAAAGPGLGLCCYLLLKPLGTSEEEAVDDVIQSGRYVSQLAARLGLKVRVALEPTFVCEGTPLAEEHRAGRFTPPSLSSVARAAASLRRLGLAVHVGLSEEGLRTAGSPGGCAQHDPRCRAALQRFNETQDSAVLESISCSCDPT